MKIGILGGKGMLGSDLTEFLGKEHDVTPIGKDNYEENKGKEFDVFINANGNSRRFWANENPLSDFEASTLSVYKSLYDFKFGKYIHISSSDVYENHSNPAATLESASINSANLSPYGLHKYMSEIIVRNRIKNHVILRSSMILGKVLRKGPLFDIMNGNPLFITLDSSLQFITTGAIADILKLCMDKNISGEIFNMGGRESFSFRDSEKYFKKIPELSPNAELQEYEMDVSKISGIYTVKTSEEYLKDMLPVWKK